MRFGLVILAILFLYIFFSTLFLETEMVGNLGKSIGEGNLLLFGDFGYINMPLLFIPLWQLYKDESLGIQIHFYIGWLLVFLAILFLQSLIIVENIGLIGQNTLAVLSPVIGKAGMWLLWFMLVGLAIVLLVDEEWSFEESALNSGNLLKRVFNRLYQVLVILKERVVKYIYLPIAGLLLSTRSDATEVFSQSTHEPLVGLDKLESTANPKTPKVDVSKKYGKSRVEEVAETQETTKEIKEEPKVEKKPPAKPKLTSSKTKPTSSVAIVDELEENTKLMNQIEQGKVAKPKGFKLPKIDFLQKAPQTKNKVNEDEIDQKIEDLLSKLQQFKVDGDVVRTYSGPLVTTFEFKPAPNVKVSKILNLQDDLAMALAAETIRIQAPIPGRDVVGIEIPNENIDTIYLRDILESEVFQNAKSPLTVALGKDIVGKPFVTDIRKLPHILIAGTTGSGKSVGINGMILSLLYKNDPDQLKLMLIDPKMLEFSMYDDIPHLITPVITEPPKAIAALANMVAEMERRYTLMAESRVKSIENYNDKAVKEGVEKFPFIVVIIDELADLMMNGGKEVEISIARLAQKSRACGIHLVVATQRPSVDVVTGIIKANLPSRLGYRVGQRIDSKVILDTQGAESLLGRGDGLFTPPGTTGLVRIHAPWSTENEIDTIVEFLKAQRLPEYDESYLVVGGVSANRGEEGEFNIDLDPLYEEAKTIVVSDNKTSISYLQRKLQIGYNRSANIIEQLEETGVLSAPNAKGQREIVG